MMIDENISVEKNLIPEDELSAERIDKSSLYKVIPFSRALDTFEIINKFR